MGNLSTKNKKEKINKKEKTKKKEKINKKSTFNKNTGENENNEIKENTIEIKSQHIKNNKQLICDDSSMNRLVLMKYLNLYGCNVDEAENGIDAINKVKENGEYNIIWMDIKMPKMNGHECTKILRNELQYKGIIIGLTGYVDDESIKKCHEVGMNYVLAKPFNADVIHMYVDEANKRFNIVFN
ncbi:putative sensor histidine kinase [Tupanvirus soda lake]|uniref:Sensor histidine kinase n=2 Tax=Tupanvirus TaxID=2094720 RepID=A0AC62ACP7_9VIRU|nr:putative sensor histidine kinase [Tupanvirus soda lake]QKU35363.1 putative sensor histidine kinase [Tupanvirus soda lake]